MRTPFDRLARWILVPILGRLGTVITEAEIVDVGLRADLAFDPALEPLRGDVRESGRIGRMADRQALWEYFYDKAVSPADLERCLKKQRYWTDGSDRRTVIPGQGRDGPLAILGSKPWLWILTARRPKKLLDKQPHTRLPGWPEGFYQIMGEEVGLVVIGE